MKAIINAKLVLEGGRVECGSLLMENGRILAVGNFIPPKDAEIIDARGLYAGPGYVDIHCHGGAQYEAFEYPAEMAAHHLRHGTTSLCASLAYDLTVEQVEQGVSRIKEAMRKGNTSLVGIHMEGPYTSPKYGSDSERAWKIDRDIYVRVFNQADGYIRQVTYAPELEGIEPFEEFLSEKGYVMAVGHTEMSPDQLERAMKAGVTIVTHLFDAMGCWRGNDSIKLTGVIQESAAEVALAREGLYYELICDSRGVHVKPVNARLTYRVAGPEGTILITDSCVQILPDGDYPPEDPRSAPDLNYNSRMQLSGSRLTMEMAAKNMQKFTGAAPEHIFMMAAETPAKAVRLFDEVGSLAPGKKANIILCDEHMNISDIYFEGEPVPR